MAELTRPGCAETGTRIRRAWRLALTIISALALWLAALPALAQGDPIIISWQTISQNAVPGDPQAPSLPPSATPLGDGITGQDLSRVGVEWNQGAHTFNSSSWPLVFDDQRYVTWGFTTDRPYQLSEMLLRVRRSNTGPEFFRVYMQVGTDPPVEVMPEQTLPGEGIASVNLVTVPIDQIIDGDVRFFLYGYGASSNAGTFTIRNATRPAPPPTAQQRAIAIRGRPVARLEADKDVMVFSEDGSACGDLGAGPPAEPENPAAIPGACIQYTISVQNTGSVAAQNITLVDELPGNLSFQAAGLGANWGAGTTLATPSAGCSGCEVSLGNGLIGAGETATITIRATVN